MWVGLSFLIGSSSVVYGFWTILNNTYRTVNENRVSEGILFSVLGCLLILLTFAMGMV